MFLLRHDDRNTLAAHFGFMSGLATTRPLPELAVRIYLKFDDHKHLQGDRCSVFRCRLVSPLFYGFDGALIQGRCQALHHMNILWYAFK